jgi:crotonobetainyl-CoA:carnitine CoA-transferase CaiB-like acyl-CoA transferase
MAGVLDGIRVLDLGRFIAGPMCGSLLGDLGAEVIRIERVGGGEDRATLPLGEEADAGASYLAFNRNKKSLTLDPASPRGREVMRRLVATADIVVINMPLDAIQKLDLDYEALKAVRPDIILVHTSAFGTDGPYMDRVGFDGVGQAMSSGVYMSGDPDDPRRTVVCWVDVSTALFNAYGALAAVLHRKATGEGQKVETNLLRSALNLTNATLIEQAMLQLDRVPTGNRAQTGGPSDLHRTKDGHVLIQVAGDTLFRRWCRIVGAEDWMTDPRFASDQMRGDNNILLSERTAAWMAERTTAEALEQLAAAKIPAGPVLKPQEVLDDPHVQAAHLYHPVHYPGLAGPVPVVEPGARFSGFDLPRNRPPTAGEHTDEILTQLGYTKVEIADLRDGGVV